MKNLINFYYNLLLKEFKKNDDHFLFEIDNIKYEFLPFEGNFKEFNRNYWILINNNKYCHEIVINKDNSVLTFYNNKAYILLKKKYVNNQEISGREIIKYDTPVYGNYNLNWKELWKDKIDYYEYQMSQISFKYKILKESFDYYIGLSETAMSILNYVNKKDIAYYICHKRINYKQKLDNFLNPINITIDSRVRDIAEYIKIYYINDDIKEIEVYKYLDIINFTYVESLLFLSRLMYPSYYFDIYDKIIQEKIGEDKVNFYIKKHYRYEVFLKKIYYYIKQKYNIPEIEWLEY